MEEIQCQDNCIFSDYDSENMNLECKCTTEETINTVDYKKFSLKKSYDVFYDVLKYSNYKVILCHKLVFNKDIFSYNKGFWIIFILFLLYLIQLGIYIFKKIKPLKINIARFHFKRKLNNKLKYKIFETYTNKNCEIIEKIDVPSIIKFQNDVLIYQKNNNEKNSDNNILKSQSNNLNGKNEDIQIFTKDIINFSEKNDETGDSTLKKEKKYDNFELNNLEYEEALNFDKRSFLEIYWSILKREQLIIFTFFFHNDYNLYYVKNARFIFN